MNNKTDSIYDLNNVIIEKSLKLDTEISNYSILPKHQFNIWLKNQSLITYCDRVTKL